jgi:ComF family protein
MRTDVRANVELAPNDAETLGQILPDPPQQEIVRSGGRGNAPAPRMQQLAIERRRCRRRFATRRSGCPAFVLLALFVHSADLCRHYITSPKISSLRALAGAGLSRLIDIITLRVCLSFQTPLATQDTLCPACWSAIDLIRPPLCYRLGIPLPYDAGTGTLSAKVVASPPLYARAVARYDGVMRELTHDLKFHDGHDGRKLFGRWLSEAGRELVADADFLVPIRLHRLELIRRCFNQSALLSAELSSLTRKPHVPLTLIRTRKTEPQIGLASAQGIENVKRAFSVPARWRPRIGGRRVLLIDDVISTGATVNAATRRLLSVGAATVDVFVLALVTDTAATMSA